MKNKQLMGGLLLVAGILIIPAYSANADLARYGSVEATGSTNQFALLTIAKELIGKFIVRKYRGREIALMIMEVEAYDGPHDRASHASRGMTPRVKIMFGEPGCFYVYFTYGMHWLVNIVTGPKGYPAAVLIRGGAILTKNHAHLVTGPARLTKFLHITGWLNGLPAAKKSKLRFEDRGIKIPPSKISAGKRIGVDYAGIWKEKLYNFKIEADTLSKLKIPSRGQKWYA